MATLYKLYVGTGRQLPDAYRHPRTDQYPHLVGKPNLEHIEASIVFSLDARDIAGATLVRGRGVWAGEIEDTTIVEVLDFDGTLGDKVRGVAASLKHKFSQDAVLLTSQEVTASLL